MINRFYDGLSARPYDVDIECQRSVLVLLERATGRQLACWTIGEMVAFDSNELNGEMTFRCRTAPEARLILGRSPQREALLNNALHLKHWQRNERLSVAKTIGALTIGGIVLIAGCYFGLAKAAAALVSHMPLAWDQKLGDPIRDGIIKHEEICTADAGQKALNHLGARLLPDNISALPLTLDIVQSKVVNAFALPGNHIVVFSGLIDKVTTPEMLAGVLAHEMGHLEMRHPTRGVAEQLGLGAVISLFAGNSSIGNLGGTMAQLSYTRDMERQADERAIALLHRANIRADGLSAFFDVLKADKDLKLPTLLSDHPGLEERATATKQDASGGPAMSPEDWQALKAICHKP